MNIEKVLKTFFYCCCDIILCSIILVYYPKIINCCKRYIYKAL